MGEKKISSELLNECSQFIRCICDTVFSLQQDINELNSSNSHNSRYLKDNSVCADESRTKSGFNLKFENLNLNSIKEFPSLDSNQDQNKIVENALLKRIKTQKQCFSTLSNLNSIKEFPSIDSNQDQNTPNKKLENTLVERMETQKHCSSTPKIVIDKENSALSSTNSFPKKIRKNKKK